MSPENPSDTLRMHLHHELASLVNLQLNSGEDYKRILDSAFDLLGKFFAFDRMAIAFINEEKEAELIWAKGLTFAQSPDIGYRAPLSGSSLERIYSTKDARIIADMESYLATHPGSSSTRRLLAEGIRSNLTFPIIADNQVTGFLFFSSRRPNAYSNEHKEWLQDVAPEISLLLRFGILGDYFKRNLASKDFLRVTLHELRSPLSVIKGFLELLRMEPWFAQLNNETREIFAILARNTDSLFHLVGQLEASQRLSFDKNPVQLTEVDLADFLAEIKSQGRLLCSKKDMLLRMDVASSLPKTWGLDAERIKQVLHNLLSNAIKFSHPRSTVTLRVAEEDQALVFTVIDQGQGIPEAEIPRLFRYFSKTSTRPTAGESSSGLGLAICKQIVDQHKGRMSVMSEAGKGSEFRFSLPRAEITT